jgi:hypothetical protein
MALGLLALASLLGVGAMDRDLLRWEWRLG